jgi:hypothetical protein
MRAGRVVTTRINPRDCMSIADVLDRAGVYTQGMSFAQAVSLALGSVLEMCRQQGILPTRDGFEYEEMMKRFTHNPKVDMARKLAITSTIGSMGSEIKIPPPAQPAPVLTPDMKRKEVRWNELAMRQQLTPENWSEEDDAEYKILCQELGIKVD